MSKRETIDHWSLLYWCTNFFLVTPIHNFFYRRIEVKHVEKIPGNEPVIFAPNHQNALMDALSLVAGINQFQTVFLARADVFTSKLVKKVLTFLKILPVYRIRDGRSQLQKNDEIFDITTRILRNKINPLCLYPEGNHGDKRRIRPLVKGIFRIAFKAQEEYKSQPGVKIIPACIDYGHYRKFRQTQFIIFGDPIEVCEYWKEYEENPAIAMNRLRDHLSDELKKLTIHIETVEYYDLYMGLRSIYGKTMRKRMGLRGNSLYNKYLADKNMIRKLDQCLEKNPEKIEKMNSVFKKYMELRKKLNFRNWVPQKRRYGILLNVLGIIISVPALPLVVLGLFNNWPHFFLPPLLQKNIKDTQFHSTAKWGAGFVLIIVYYLILFVLALIFIPFWWLKLLYIVTLPSSGIFALAYRRFIIKSWARIRYTFGRMKNGSETNVLKENYDKLIALTNEAIDSL
jgi:1-acyl-sn-glycerol-3-phosphate acyltransferase